MRDDEVAVRRAFMVELRESHKKGDPRLGFAQINYGRIFVRDYWTLFAIARELECSVEDLLETKEKPRSGPRYSEVVTASETVLDEVRALPIPQRRVVEWRGRGLSWRRIQQSSPGRVDFSLRDDYHAAIRHLGRSCRDHLNFLASLDNFFVVSGVRRMYVEGTLNAPSQ